MVIRQNCFRVKHQGWKGVVCAFGGSVALRRPMVLSHGSILLPWLVGCCASGCAQRGGQGAEETS